MKKGENIDFDLKFIIKEGLLDPEKWIEKRWIIININNIIGNKKWSLKKNFRVRLLTAKPLQIHWTIAVPINGMTEKNLVITVAAQNDICPHGKTYPRKAVIIKINKILTPEFQVLEFLNDKK